MTYSLVAADVDAGLVGVAAQSHHLACGAHVVFAEAGLGAVAVQSYAERSHGPGLLDALRSGASAPAAVAGAMEGDRRASRSQLAVVTAAGETAVHTGGRCVPAAGQAEGDGAACQANMVAGERVWLDALDGFRSAAGHLAWRLLAGLDAAQEAGGDVRGMQAAALLVVGSDGTRIDVRVDDHPRPLEELRRLTQLSIASARMSAAFDLAAAGNVDGALAELVAVQEVYGPDNLEPTVWAAVLAARGGDPAAARRLLAPALAQRAQWADFVAGLATVGLFPDDDGIIAEVTGR